MNTDDLIELIEMIPPDERDPRIRAAVSELQTLVLAKFPMATFGEPHRDDSDGISFVVTVDTDDLDDVVDVVLPRMVDMLVEEGLPVYVVPEWPAWRIREQLRQKSSLPSAESIASILA